MNMSFSRKEILFDNLKECLRELGEYNINAYVPLLYVLVALKHKIPVIANEESRSVFPEITLVQFPADTWKYGSGIDFPHNRSV